MKEYDNIIETVLKQKHDYMFNNIEPKSVFISKDFVDSLKNEYFKLVNEPYDDKMELTLCGLKVYRVLEKGIIKVSDY